MDLTEQELATVIQFRSDSVIVSDFGNFMRVLLPVNLDNGRVGRLWIWVIFLSVDEARRASAAGRSGGDDWANLVFEAVPANSVEPWPDMPRALVTVAVQEQIPVIVSSVSTTMQDVLTRTWSHTEFLSSRAS